MPCADGKPGKDGQYCPYIANAPQTVEELQAIDILNVSGHADITAQMQVMQVSGCGSKAVMDLVFAGSTAMYLARKEDDQDGG